MADLTGAVWRKSTRSDTGGNSCVEVAKNVPGVVGVRDSKDRFGPVLTFDPDAWTRFLDGVKNGEFELASD
ncbi:uncharacterized protein DUF397 [Krasilnikovia cinnamomea]|uniref:Uncharacterized protein DUF397 n=1 Tax=Krasilnikovia cinnamomea TaxID=349313 RepID=A0A4V2G7D2_9ACTN|nr:DUF397 domain-containing protein [Krasilnikovia cinnamomea]RZU52116.1 uncharacterized protein DUF397 [Krasilnikovia cinnamomea]